MPITFKGGAAAGGTNGATTAPLDTTGADFLVLTISGWTGVSLATVSDSKGNTWTARPILNAKFRLYDCPSPIVGPGHTFTTANSGQYPAIAVQAFSGVHAAPFDLETTNTLHTTFPLTPSQDNSLVITGSHCAGGALSVDLGYTPTIQPFVGGTNMGAGIAHLIQTTAASTAPTWTNGGPVTLNSFKPAEAVSATVYHAGGAIVLAGTSPIYYAD